jgi:threonine dehydratase
MIHYSLESIPGEAFSSARGRIADMAVRTPLVRLNLDDAPAEIYLKLENLQPTGAFKLRGAVNAIHPFLDWLAIYRTRHFEGAEGLFIHAFSDPGVMAGNGTIALEILEDLPDVDAVITPYGGGGLTCGVAAAFRHFKPDTRFYAAEADVAIPVTASLAAGRSVEVPYTPSFIDGIGAPFLFTEMWEFAQQLLDGSVVASLAEVTAAVKLLAVRNRIVAEGAGATPVAAALTGKAGGGKIVCVVSGGNIDIDKFARILLDQPL